MRRLITLISAGRNRTIVVRRELPVTNDAGWVEAPYRIKVRRVLLSVSPRPVSGSVATKSIIESPRAWQPQPAIPWSKVSVLQRHAGTRQGRAKRAEGKPAGWRGCDRKRSEGMAGPLLGVVTPRIGVALVVPPSPQSPR